MTCSRCGAVEDRAANRLGHCRNCHNTLLGQIQTRASNIAQNVCYWMEKAELNHLQKIFYSDEAEDLTDLKQYASNGRAEGFVSEGKTFNKRHGWASSAAVRAFIDGGMTICECEGLTHAVFFNALLDVVTLPVFDLMFQDVTIGLGCTIKVLMDNRNIMDDSGVTRGDWVYILNKDRGFFTDTVQDSRQGAAGGGWNLVCTQSAPIHYYMGFGLNAPGQTQAATLDTIRDKMLDIKKKPKEETKHKKRGSVDLGKKTMGFEDTGLNSFIRLQWHKRFNANKIMIAVTAALTPTD